MINLIKKNILLTLGLVGMTAPLIAEELTPMQQEQQTRIEMQEINSFKEMMLREVKKQQDKVDSLEKQMQDRSYSPMSINKVELANAAIMLDVKTTLVNNFINSPLLSSQKMREALLRTLRKDVIMESDLAYLQNVANQERSKSQTQTQDQR